MSMYTTKVRYICEIEYLKNNPSASSDDLENTWEVCKNVHKNIFNFDYPLIAELKDDFETRFLMHYYLKEIGQETVGVWKHYINEKLQIISETYNQLYKSVNMDFDILNPLHYTETENIKFDETANQKNSNSSDINRTIAAENETEKDGSNNSYRDGGTQGTTTSNDSGNSNTVHKEINTPQGNLQSFLDNNHMSRATQDYGDSTASGKTETSTSHNDTDETEYNETVNETSTTTDTTNSTSNSNIDNTKNNVTERSKVISGKSDNIPQSELILKYRETVINLIEQLIDEFEDNFMLVYDTFDSQMGTINNFWLGGKYYG